MYLSLCALFITLFFHCVLVICNSCPCEKPELCQPVNTTQARKEVFVFSISNHTWRYWNWTKITTVIAAGYHDDELMCFAHAHNARYGMVVNIDVSLLTNSSATSLWLEKQISVASSHHVDAINFDIEEPIADKSPQQLALTQLVKNLTMAFKSGHPQRQVTYDLAWRPGGVDGRFYDEFAIANIVDFVFVMSYDTQSQIKEGPCIAKANTPFSRILTGYGAYIKEGIPASKLVMGIPWYGYHYECTQFEKNTDTCHIPYRPFRGVNCSDAAGSEYDFSRVMKVQKMYHAQRKWNNTYLSPYFNYFDNSTKKWNQIWYDDLQSLKYKFDYARGVKLRGVGMWNADELDYSDSSSKITKEMWLLLSNWDSASTDNNLQRPIFVKKLRNREEAGNVTIPPTAVLVSFLVTGSFVGVYTLFHHFM